MQTFVFAVYKMLKFGAGAWLDADFIKKGKNLSRFLLVNLAVRQDAEACLNLKSQIAKAQNANYFYAFAWKT